MKSSPPGLAHYNIRAASLDVLTGGGHPLRFVAPDGDPTGYELRAFERGEVVTRPDNWHDAYNAEVWLEFPRSKATMNRRHVAALTSQQAQGLAARGTVRDRLTQFDECGVVILGLRSELWQALCAHRWREVFVAAREEVRAEVRFLIFGHASRDALRAPYLGLCGKALWLDGVPADAPPVAIDAALSSRLASTDLLGRWQPLPLLGIPGMTPENEDPAYYDDPRQFRPARAAATVD